MKKLKIFIAITIPIIVVCIVSVFVINTLIIPKQKFNKAMQMLNSGDYAGASSLLEDIGDNDEVNSSRYHKAMKQITAGNYEAAYVLLDGLDYKDSYALMNSIKPEYEKLLIKRAEVGSYVKYGAYEQDNDISNGKEDLEWLVLSKDGDKALLISKYALDCQQYNTVNMSTTWENCSLRMWLNGTFLNEAFNSEEQDSIITSTVTADKNPSYETTPGNNTEDRIFLLSIPEANTHFSSDEARTCAPTDYAIAQGAWISEDFLIEGRGTCCWWLRTPGLDSISASYIKDNGYSFIDGVNVDDSRYAVRPALWISLDS